MEKSNKTLYVLVGVPASGKSTWLRKHVRSLNAVPVSRDGIRFALLGPNDDYFSKEKEVYDMFINQIKAGLDVADNVIADATHITKGSRAKLFHNLGKSLVGVKVIAIVFKSDLNTLLARNEQRTGKEYVPRSVMRRMYYQFDMPELKEGFDEIWIYEGYKYIIIEEEVD